MRLAFLCGAGSSISSGMPSTRKITANILSGDGIARHTDANYYFMRPLYDHMGWDDEYVPKVCGFMQILKMECDRFYTIEGTEEQKQSWWEFFGKHETNYEDLYYLAAQIHDSQTGEHENPALQPLIDKITQSDEFRRVIEMPVRGSRRRLEFTDLHMETCNYIECVVWGMLWKRPRDLAAPRMFAELLQDAELVERIDVFTLNHDTVLESLCAANGVTVADGFGMPENGIRYWNPTLLDDAQRCRLLKLHGSVNWVQYPSNGQDWSSRYVGIPEEGDIWHTTNRQGELQLPTTGRPKMLIGTFNKPMSYTTGIFADLHFRFYRDLPLADAVIVCGYGFGDKGINTRLLEWIYSSQGRKAVVIDPNLEELQWTARGAIRRSWKSLKQSGKLLLINKGIEDVSWTDLKGMLVGTWCI